MSSKAFSDLCLEIVLAGNMDGGVSIFSRKGNAIIPAAVDELRQSTSLVVVTGGEVKGKKSLATLACALIRCISVVGYLAPIELGA